MGPCRKCPRQTAASVGPNVTVESMEQKSTWSLLLAMVRHDNRIVGSDRCTDQPAGMRQVSLPDGRLLVIRHAEVTDVDRMIAFYRRLPLEDRYFRFFTGGMPPRSHFERVVAHETGGVALVVEVMADGGTAELIGEACYVPQTDALGELAVTIDPHWRGWLGPYLLDALLEAAAARGISTLEAEILVRNRPMLALVRARGCVTIGDDDLSKVRVALGTATRVPSWPRRNGRRRVLVEAANPRWRLGMMGRPQQLDVRVCPGPPAAYRERCPMLTGKPCPLAAEADAIVVAGSLDDALARDLIEAHTRELKIPFFVESIEPEVLSERPVMVRHLPRALDDAAAARRIIDAIDEVAMSQDSESKRAR